MKAEGESDLGGAHGFPSPAPKPLHPSDPFSSLLAEKPQFAQHNCLG